MHCVFHPGEERIGGWVVLPDGRRSPRVTVHPVKNSLVCTPKPHLGVINFPCPTLLCREAVLVNTELSRVSLLETSCQYSGFGSGMNCPFPREAEKPAGCVRFVKEALCGVAVCQLPGWGWGVVCKASHRGC